MPIAIRTLARFFAALCVVLSCACASSKSAPVVAGGPASWLKPSPLLRQQLDDEAARLPWTRGLERVELIRWFASIGEPAYSKLFELLEDPRQDVAAAAYAALGVTGDKRLVTPLLEVPWTDAQKGTDLELERARTLVRLGCWQEIPTLIRGLADERLYTRALCIDALSEATGQTLDFEARGSASSREIARERWERWWLKYSGDPLR
jgi:hypothetical protein